MGPIFILAESSILLGGPAGITPRRWIPIRGRFLLGTPTPTVRFMPLGSLEALLIWEGLSPRWEQRPGIILPRSIRLLAPCFPGTPIPAVRLMLSPPEIPRFT